MKDCCKTNNKSKKCIRKKDNKVFTIPRKFTKKRCIKGPIRGFTMRSSCAPYKFCKNKTQKKQFLFNTNNPKKSFDVYIDKDPSDTIPISYTTLDDVKNTIIKLEKLYKNNKYNHKRIWQVAMILKVRLGVIKKYAKTKYKNAKNIHSRYNLANKYFKFVSNRTKEKEEERKLMTFTL